MSVEASAGGPIEGPPAPPSGPSGSWLVALSLLFFCSGACGLIYQILWLRLLGLIFGVTTYAASAVWASFMAGLALGSVAAGFLADRVRRPLAWFGASEVLIGITALATPGALDALQRAYVRLYPALASSIALLIAARFAIAFAVLIVPTALMGATLPLVVKSSVFRSRRLGERLGLLYGTNTAGAILGTLAAGLYLVPSYGLQRTFLVAATVNIGVGLCAIAIASVATSAPARAVTDAAARSEAIEPTMASAVESDGARRVVLAVFAISGFTALALEVVWFRVLTLFLRPTVYGFSLMLAAVLAGVAIGSYATTPWLDRRGRWVLILGGVELAIGVAAVQSFAFLIRMNDVTTALRPALTRVMHEWLVYPTVGSVLAIFPTALLMGAAFPIGLRVWSDGRRGVDEVGRRIGRFYSLNVAGSILGATAAGFVLLPWAGSRVSILVLSTLSVACGLLLLAVAAGTRRTRLAIATAGLALFAVAAWRSPDPFRQFIAQRYPRQAIVWQEEGVEATVVVHARGDELTLSVNGNHQASTGPAMTRGHRFIGHLPMVLHPEARSALVIGLGGGATAGAVSIHDGVEVDVVELAGAVPRGARLFKAINYDVLARPNVHLRVDDGRNYLLLTERRYDVVTADVIQPIYAGSGNLYSAEYFRLLRRVLKPGGIVVQWAAGTDAEYKLIARTFLSVFPNTTVWGDGTLLVGAVEPLHLKRGDFDWKLQMPGRAQGARELGVQTFDQLLRLSRAGSDELRAFVGDGPLLTDDRPQLEYFLSLPRDHDVDLSRLKREGVARITYGAEQR